MKTLYRATVIDALGRMPHGRLDLRLPGGRELALGSGSNPGKATFGTRAEMTILDEELFRRCFYFGDIGIAEGYMEGDWETPDLASLIGWFILNQTPRDLRSRVATKTLNWLGGLNHLAHRLRGNSIKNSRRNIAEHYDLSNDLFALFLDPSMTYSAALFDGEHALAKPEEVLERAQEAKYDRLCQKLQLRSGHRVLEIGGGWGGFSRYAATNYGCELTSITISRAQYDYARSQIASQNLSDQIDVLLADYREIDGTYDRIVSIEMLEAVGHEHFDAFFHQCERLLDRNGVLGLQVITCPEQRYDEMRRRSDFIQKYIFPGGLLPSISALMESANRVSDLMLHDLRDLGDSYVLTLEAWSSNFERQIEKVRALGFDDLFIRKWRYYLAYCIAAFRMRHVSVVQMVMTRPNNHSLIPAYSNGGQS